MPTKQPTQLPRAAAHSRLQANLIAEAIAPGEELAAQLNGHAINGKKSLRNNSND
jgi:hypothetical protein